MRTASEDWNPSLYLKFEDERTRPPRDLVAQIPLAAPRRIVDIGCGPGNSTQLLAERWPQAEVLGIDSSPNMVKQASERLPSARFAVADVGTWAPEPGTDLVFGNAVFQWVPDHPAVLVRLLEALPEGGVLAVQMPDNVAEPSHVLMAETAAEGPWAGKIAGATRDELPAVGAYYDLLKPVARQVEIWHTHYQHALDGAPAIVEWFKSTALRPYLDPLDAAEREAFLAAYTARIAQAYPARVDGKVLLRFPRLFIVAVR
ncbi:trans-aconitate 2-methyltransferase [Ancylobacter defluvii]|uniref:Trans-aconitate 2-methyltransferase n=1 Tax=Ancylobacter defluvii TaxID=1282440 RepID=A0A9W6JWS1_9HYPH|nr:trans-aconitate 2-methyltransferase [Ancylobacter defluvii]MBS7588996.1 trans-aconitate 2-methyltransferase [Ancylobacter defluvii]GLK84602.1 trans-aconitate 2-methyltransferase [Ancylobacter defluvii]